MPQTQRNCRRDDSISWVYLFFCILTNLFWAEYLGPTRLGPSKLLNPSRFKRLSWKLGQETKQRSLSTAQRQKHGCGSGEEERFMASAERPIPRRNLSPLLPPPSFSPLCSPLPTRRYASLSLSKTFQLQIHRNVDLNAQTGSGSQIMVYDLELGRMVRSFDVFQGIRVHGIICCSSSSSTERAEGTLASSVAFKISVFGERRVKMFTLQIETVQQVNVSLTLLQSLPKFANWVLDVSFFKVKLQILMLFLINYWVSS